MKKKNKPIVGKLLMMLGALGILLEFIIAPFLVNNCFGNNSSIKLIEFLFFGTLIYIGIHLSKRP